MKKLFITGLLLLFTSNVNAAEHLIPLSQEYDSFVIIINEHFQHDKYDNYVEMPNGNRAYRFNLEGYEENYIYEPTEQKIFTLKRYDKENPLWLYKECPNDGWIKILIEKLNQLIK